MLKNCMLKNAPLQVQRSLDASRSAGMPALFLSTPKDPFTSHWCGWGGRRAAHAVPRCHPVLRTLCPTATLTNTWQGAWAQLAWRMGTTGRPLQLGHWRLHPWHQQFPVAATLTPALHATRDGGACKAHAPPAAVPCAGGGVGPAGHSTAQHSTHALQT